MLLQIMTQNIWKFTFTSTTVVIYLASEQSLIKRGRHNIVYFYFRKRETSMSNQIKNPTNFWVLLQKSVNTITAHYTSNRKHFKIHLNYLLCFIIIIFQSPHTSKCFSNSRTHSAIGNVLFQNAIFG